MAGRGISPAGEWDVCGDRFYHKQPLYQMTWSNVNLDHLRVACARYGGPIASVRDDRKMVKITGADTRPVVKTFTAAGHLLGAFVWDRGRIAQKGWTDEEDLLIISDTGEVLLYGMHGGKLLRQFSLGAECQRDGVVDACIYGKGLVVLTSTFQLWTIADLDEPRPQKLANPGISEPPYCMAIIEPSHTLSGCVEVLLACGDTVIVVDAESADDQMLTLGPVMQMAVTPNGQLLAAYTEDGQVVVILADFTKVLSESATDPAATPRQIAWCGMDSVVLRYQDRILMIGPYGDTVEHLLEEPAVLVPELDAVRIVANSCHELLRRVPDATAEVFRVGSTAPGALLYDAREMFNEQNAKADEVLRSIVDSLPEAVMTCLEAAGADLDPVRQKALMKAAVYGKAFCRAESVSRGALVEMARKLRVLNALRAPEVGLPVTMAQLEALSLGVVVGRLIATRRHLLALRISHMLGLGPAKVLVHWACAKISAAADMPDEALRDALAGKLRGHHGIRYATIAAHAQGVGRRSLAAMLLEYERCAAEQVPLLLSLGEAEAALQAACDSGDTDLVYLALFHMNRAMPLTDFLAALNPRPLARNLLTAYCARKEPELLEQIWMSKGVYEGLAEMRVREAVARSAAITALRSAAPPDTPALTAELAALLDRAADLYAKTKEHTFQSKACAEFARLRRLQAELEAETGNACFLGLSVTHTLRQCIRLNNARAAAKVRNEFRVSDKHFYHIKVKTLAAAKDWEGLESFAREKKASPVGFEPFVAAAKAFDAPEPATARFIARLPDDQRKAEEYASIGMFTEAAEAAAQSKDSAMLSKIQGMVGTTSSLGMAVAQIRDRLAAGR